MTAATAQGKSSAPMRYDRIAMALHWVIAFGVITQIALGLWMIDIPK